MCLVSSLFRANRALRDEDIKLIEKELRPMLAGSPGFKHWFWAPAGERETLSVSVWDTKAHALAAREKTTAWNTEHFGSAIVGDPERYEGEVRVTA